MKKNQRQTVLEMMEIENRALLEWFLLFFFSFFQLNFFFSSSQV